MLRFILLAVVFIFIFQWTVSSVQWEQPKVEWSETPYSNKEFTLLDASSDEESSFREDLQFVT